MSSHSILPNSEILRQLILFEEVNFLQSIVSLFINTPLFSSHELCFFIVIQSNALAANGHILAGVALCIGDNLIVIGVLHTV